jgi:Mrp family chromosome partitioning ATPase/capsular polysaccharide biosynthesis protein
MNETTDATAVFAPLWRRKWMILAVAILVAAGSYLYYKRQPSRFSATTEVYLGNGAEEQSQIGGVGGAKKANAPNPTTQAALINSSIVKGAVHERLRHERKTPVVRAALKGKVKAKATSEKGEFITIDGEAHNARGAALLVNLTAQTYIKRQNAHYRRQVEDAIALARRQLRRIEAGQIQSLIAAASTAGSKKNGAAKSSAGATATIQSATLSTKINQLEADLGVSQVTQVNPAKTRQSVLVSPHPRSNALFGFAIGLVLAAFAAYALGRLDRRLRSPAAMEEVFQAQILTALRAVRHPLISREGRPAPAYVLREALWRLQTTLRVAGPSSGENGAGRGPRTILCVSAEAGDGRSTLTAALALAWAEAGERVALLEADFRRPVQSKLLHLAGSHGLADVLTATLPAEQAMQSVNLVRAEASLPTAKAQVAGSTATILEPAGSLSVLVGGTEVANPPALLGRLATAELVRSLAQEFDYVLIDAPSPLQVSDVMPLLGAVDGILIVARAGHTRASSGQRLVALLQRTPSAPILGVVANGISRGDVGQYGIHSEVRQGRGLRRNLIGR